MYFCVSFFFYCIYYVYVDHSVRKLLGVKWEGILGVDDASVNWIGNPFMGQMSVIHKEREYH